ncbi:uncharacterized protein [Rutidosis leptorrhynchoides]|uniref:uncharacterized protein n=1 Tax=Rutidosis leptorrhynchoides TaxID=125765 RepID=UPI003A999D66
MSGVTIEIDGHSFHITCLMMSIPSFDVVVGMNWLSSNRANIKCHKKIICFPLANGSRVIARGEHSEFNFPMVSLMKVQKAILKGRDSFLAYVIDFKKEKKKFSDISVVSEFLEVFPDELPGLPLVPEVKYKIDFVPGATPVAKDPYRSAPSEIREMVS